MTYTVTETEANYLVTGPGFYKLVPKHQYRAERPEIVRAIEGYKSEGTKR